MPDFRPETAAACNAVRLSVAVAADGSIRANDAPVTEADLLAPPPGPFTEAGLRQSCDLIESLLASERALGVPAARTVLINSASGGEGARELTGRHRWNLHGAIHIGISEKYREITCVCKCLQPRRRPPVEIPE